MKKNRKIFYIRQVMCILTCLFLQKEIAFTQTTNISGVVNTYHQVIEVIPAKACVRVSSTAGLVIYKKVLLIQMKGASVVTTNNASFGDTTSLNNAGNYEMATICNIIGDSVFMFHSLLNSYTVADKVQLVQFGQYASALVTDTIKAKPWNNATGTGGVIALYVYDDLTLNAPIFADSSGFRGGAFVQSNGTCSNFFPASGYIYNASSTAPQNGASKGENIYDLPAAQTGGRGAPANGGGGGNNHNNSGGGGANLTAGGIGGGNSSTAGCTTNLRGLAGKALRSWSGKKIFTGGGGGAGHSNGAIVTVGGGNGGGIIIIRATNIFGNGYKISANGGVGGNSVSDGAAGGGAGGTIIMYATNYSGTESIEAKGGNGGASNDGGNVGRCYGGGGGGSGGVIYFNGSTPAITINTNGGSAGAETGRDVSCAAPIPAGAGSSGTIVNNYNFSWSASPAGYCAPPLAVQLENFSVKATAGKVQLNWTVLNPENVLSFIVQRLHGNDWENYSTIMADNLQNNYLSWDNSPVKGKNFYRLKITEAANIISYSAVRQVNFEPGKISFYPNPAHNRIVVTGTIVQPADVFFYDLSGKLVLQKRISPSTVELDISSLQPGLYCIKFNDSVWKLIIH